MATYKNSFYNPEVKYSEVEFTTDTRPVEYKGFLIYQRVKGLVFDVVENGICIIQCAGLNGAKKAIDKRIGSTPPL